MKKLIDIPGYGEISISGLSSFGADFPDMLLAVYAATGDNPLRQLAAAAHLLTRIADAPPEGRSGLVVAVLLERVMRMIEAHPLPVGEGDK